MARKLYLYNCSMINEHFGILAAIIPVVGDLSYLRDVLRGITQPNRVSWLLWAVAPLIAFAAELVEHTRPEIALLTLSVGFGPLFIVAASFLNRKAAHWKVTRFDLFCGSVSLVALALWFI